MGKLKVSALESTVKQQAAFTKGRKVAPANGFPIWETDLSKTISILAKIVPTKSTDNPGFTCIPRNTDDYGRFLVSNSTVKTLINVTGSQYDGDDEFPVAIVVVAAQEPKDLTLEEVTARYKDTPNGAKAIANWKEAVENEYVRYCVVSLEEVEFENWD